MKMKLHDYLLELDLLTDGEILGIFTDNHCQGQDDDDNDDDEELD